MRNQHQEMRRRWFLVWIVDSICLHPHKNGCRSLLSDDVSVILDFMIYLLRSVQLEYHKLLYLSIVDRPMQFSGLHAVVHIHSELNIWYMHYWMPGWHAPRCCLHNFTGNCRCFTIVAGEQRWHSWKVPLLRALGFGRRETNPGKVRKWSLGWCWKPRSWLVFRFRIENLWIV